MSPTPNGQRQSRAHVQRLNLRRVRPQPTPCPLGPALSITPPGPRLVPESTELPQQNQKMENKYINK